jgi:hypothetical protein
MSLSRVNATLKSCKFKFNWSDIDSSLPAVRFNSRPWKELLSDSWTILIGKSWDSLSRNHLETLWRSLVWNSFVSMFCVPPCLPKLLWCHSHVDFPRVTCSWIILSENVVFIRLSRTRYQPQHTWSKFIQKTPWLLHPESLYGEIVSCSCIPQVILLLFSPCLSFWSPFHQRSQWLKVRMLSIHPFISILQTLHP